MQRDAVYESSNVCDCAIFGCGSVYSGSCWRWIVHKGGWQTLSIAKILCGYLVLKGDPLGYVIASPLLTLIVILAPQIILSTVFQKDAGVPFTPGEMIGPISGFVILGFIALWLLIRILQVVSKVVV